MHAVKTFTPISIFSKIFFELRDCDRK